MNTLTQARSTIEQALTAAGVPAVDHVPERLNPPCAIVQADSPWLEPGGAFGEFHVHYNVTLVAARAANKVATDALDELVAASVIALVALDGAWGLERVEGPISLTYNAAEYVAATIAVVLTTHIETS